MAARGQAEQVRQELVQAVKRAQYVQALDLCQQLLSLQPGDATAQEILTVLQEKVQLDAESDQAGDHDQASSEQDGSSSEEEDSEDSNGRQPSDDEQSDEEGDSVQPPAKTPSKQCTRLQEAPPAAPNSAESRMQLKQALRDQIEDLRVQQAAAAMQEMNPLL